MMSRNHTWCSLYYEPLIYMKSQNDKIGLIRTIDKVGPFTFWDYPHIWWCLLDTVYLIWFVWARLTLDNRCSLDHITALHIHCLSWWDYINLKKRRFIFYMAYVIWYQLCSISWLLRSVRTTGVSARSESRLYSMASVHNTDPT